VDVDQLRLGAVTLDGARLGFTQGGSGAPPPAFKRASLASLAGDGATLEFNADFTAVSGLKTPGSVADHLTISGSSAGTHTVRVNALGGMPGGDEIAIPLITGAGETGGAGGAGDAAVYQLAGGKLSFGLTEFGFARGSAAAAGTLPLAADTWYLFSTGLSQAADVIMDTASILGKDWHYGTDALHLRLGEVHQNLIDTRGPGAKHDSGSVWTRTRGYRLNAGNALSGRGFREYAHGVTAGGDKIFETAAGANLAGAFVDMGRITRDFDGVGNKGATTSISAGLYGTALRDNGWYADLVLRADRYKHSFEVRTVSGHPVAGNYAGDACGVSLELGRYLECADGWWVEPGVQAAMAWLGGASYRTTPESAAIRVQVDDSRAAQYRGALRFGRRLRNSRWIPHGGLGMVKTNTSGGTIHAPDQNRHFAPGYDGWRFEAGFGAACRVNDRSQLYFDYAYGKAPAYERPWSINLGYRHLW
jgi:outer membrane autotransporter protein